MDDMLCHVCGRTFTDTDNEFCPFCGSSDIEVVGDDVDDDDTVLLATLLGIMND